MDGLDLMPYLVNLRKEYAIQIIYLCLSPRNLPQLGMELLMFCCCIQQAPDPLDDPSAEYSALWSLYHNKCTEDVYVPKLLSSIKQHHSRLWEIIFLYERESRSTTLYVAGVSSVAVNNIVVEFLLW